VKRLLRAVLVLVVVAALAAAAVAAWILRQLETPRAFGAPGEARVFVAETGSSSRAILERLEREGLVDSALVVRLYLTRVLGDPPLQAGEYRFVSPVAATEVLRVLRAGEVMTHPVTIVEGLTLVETADALAGAGFGEREALLRAFRDPAPVAELDPEAESLEGYLFPDTYRFPRGTGAREIARALVDGFRRAQGRAVAPVRTADDERPLREIVILASLVEKEAKLEDERPLIAAVYANRLRLGMGLYADPTIIYGKKLEGTWDGNLRRTDLEADSPWNTYRIAGLPPGPICSPGEASLRAAARPAEADYLYFVSRNDGSHVFSRSLAEHNRAVDLWQRQYFRRGK
jgi:UPF0755 protein